MADLNVIIFWDNIILPYMCQLLLQIVTIQKICCFQLHHLLDRVSAVYWKIDFMVDNPCFNCYIRDIIINFASRCTPTCLPSWWKSRVFCTFSNLKYQVFRFLRNDISLNCYFYGFFVRVRIRIFFVIWTNYLAFAPFFEKFNLIFGTFHRFYAKISLLTLSSWKFFICFCPRIWFFLNEFKHQILAQTFHWHHFSRFPQHPKHFNPCYTIL